MDSDEEVDEFLKDTLQDFNNYRPADRNEQSLGYLLNNIGSAHCLDLSIKRDNTTEGWIGSHWTIGKVTEWYDWCKANPGQC